MGEWLKKIIGKPNKNIRRSGVVLLVVVMMTGMLALSFAMSGDEAQGEETGTKTPVPDGLLSISAVNRNQPVKKGGGYQSVTAASLEIGDRVYFQIAIDSKKLNSAIMDRIRTVSLDIKDHESVSGGESGDESDANCYFEYRANGGKAWLENQSGQELEGSESGYQVTMDGETLRFTTPEDESALVSGKLYILVPLTVKKAVDESVTVSMKNVSVTGSYTEPETVEGTEDSGEPKVQRGLYYSEKITKTAAINNTMAGKRKLELTLEKSFDNDTGNISVFEGKTFSLPVYVMENTGFNKATITIDVIQGLQYKDVHLSAEFRKLLQSITVEEESSQNRVKVSVETTYDIHLKAGTRLLTCEFLAESLSGLANGAKKGQSMDIGVHVVSVSNQSGTKMNWDSKKKEQVEKTAKRSIFVRPESAYGDINDDGVLNLVDAAYLLQYYNHVRILNEDQIKHGDINGDGWISLVDVLLVMNAYNNGRYTGWAIDRIPT